MNHLLHRTACIGLSIITSLVVCACSDAESARRPIDPDQPLRIVATIRPLELIARDVLEPAVNELVEIELLIPPDASPHGFEPTPKQVATLREADVIVHNGLGLDDWATRDASKHTLVLRFADVLDEGDDAHEHDAHDHDHQHDHDHGHGHAHGDHDHGPVDAHLWLDPPLVDAFAKLFTSEVGRLLDTGDNQAHQTLQESLASFSAASSDVDDAFASALAQHQGRRIVTHHNVFVRIADRYGLGEPIVLRPVETLEPTPSDIRNAIDIIREENISHVFIEPQFSPAAADRIAAETEAQLISVDPLGSEAESWPAFMHDLLDALVRGLGQQ